VTDWIRSAAELDIFHDLFGHDPLLFDPRYASHIQAYGQGALKAHALEHGPEPIPGAVEMISRLYWYTIEFGLVLEESQPRAYGAGILDSPGERVYSVQSGVPKRTPLQGLSASDFTPLYQALAQQACGKAGRLRPPARRRWTPPPLPVPVIAAFSTSGKATS
jgi:phenylalanine-4-hydroxylase